MNLSLFNSLLNNVKDNNVVQNFINEISNYLENMNNKLSNQKDNGLKQEGCIYQVVDMGTDGAYLQNVSNNKILYEKDISKEVLNEIGNDTVLRYEKGEYSIDEELTQKFFNNLVGIKEYQEIQDKFMKESNILKNDPKTKYKIEMKNKNYCILSYGCEIILKVPKELIPFWAKRGEILCFANGEFKRNL